MLISKFVRWTSEVKVKILHPEKLSCYTPNVFGIMSEISTTLFISVSRRRLTCFRSQEGAWKGPSSPAGRSAALSNKSLLMPSLSAPFTPGARPYVQRRRPTNAETGTQTGRSRLSSGLSWTSVSSLNTAGGGGGGGVGGNTHTTTAGIHPRSAAAGSAWTLLPAVPPTLPGSHIPGSPYTRSLTPGSRSGTPASLVSSPSLSTSSSTQTPRVTTKGKRPQKTSGAQTEVSGSIKSRHHSSHHHASSSGHHTHRSGHSSGHYSSRSSHSSGHHSTYRSARSRRRAPLPPIPGEWTLTPGGRELRQVPPIHYVHTILRTVPGGSTGTITRPPYDEATTDMTKAEVIEGGSNDSLTAIIKDINETVARQDAQYKITQNGHNSGRYGQDVLSQDGRCRDAHGREAHGQDGYGQNGQSQESHSHDKPLPLPRGHVQPLNTATPTNNHLPSNIPPQVQLRPQPKLPAAQRRLSDLSLPPPPPECMPFAHSPVSTLNSRKMSISSIKDGTSTYSTVKPRHRPRPPLSDSHGWDGNNLQSNKRQSSGSTRSK